MCNAPKSLLPTIAPSILGAQVRMLPRSHQRNPSAWPWWPNRGPNRSLMRVWDLPPQPSNCAEQGISRVRALIKGKLKLGADASIAAGPVGRDAEASTNAAMSAQILSYSRAQESLRVLLYPDQR
jgi:hypothetical protein